MTETRNTNRPGRIHEITAVSNPRVKSVRSLFQKKHRDQSETFLVEGLKLVMDAIAHDWHVETLIYSKGGEVRHPVEELAAKIRVLGGDILEVNNKVLSSITRKDNPQSVLGVVRQKWSKPPAAVKDPKTVWIGLDRIRDPGNLGTIIRTADSAGADGIILIGDTTDPFSVEATRATMGSIFNVPLVRMTNEAFLGWRKTWQGLVVGTHLKGAVDFRAIDYAAQPVFLLMGNEQQGMPDDLSAACDKLALIPMHGAADSLNLAIATGVFLFHMGKRLPNVGTDQARGPQT
ncbi:MAG: RNA methyltransferase [Rhizobiaceae bacterium]|nr:RNA methyltransferase [Rhizobiaceae bacterium]